MNKLDMKFNNTHVFRTYCDRNYSLGDLILMNAYRATKNYATVIIIMKI